MTTISIIALFLTGLCIAHIRDVLKAGNRVRNVNEVQARVLYNEQINLMMEEAQIGKTTGRKD